MVNTSDILEKFVDVTISIEMSISGKKKSMRGALRNEDGAVIENFQNILNIGF